MQICLNSPLPTLDGIMASFKPLMTFPPKFPELPKIPLLSLPYPLFPSLKVPNFELMLTAIELQAFQLQTTIMGMIKPILDKLGISLLSFLPKIPGLPGLTLIDLLSGNGEKIAAAVRAAIKNGLRLPGIPFPLYVTLTIPDFEVIQTMQMIVSNYMMIVAKMIPDLIKKVMDKFKWKPKLPAIPKLPTMPEIMAMIASMLPPIPGLPNINDLRDKLKQLQADAESAVDDAKAAIEAKIAAAKSELATQLARIPSMNDVVTKLKAMIMDKVGNFDIMKFMAKITFPGLPALPVIPLPLVFSFKMPDVEFAVALNALVNHLTTAFLKPVLDFILKTLGKFLKFTLPKICITISVPAIPTLPTITIPSIPPIGG